MNLKATTGFGIIGILIAVAVVAIAGIGGWSFKDQFIPQSGLQTGINAEKEAEDLKNLIENKQKELQNEIGETTAKTEEVDNSTWKTYRNSVAGFEFKYPFEWQEPSSPPNMPPFNLPDYEMKYGNNFFVALDNGMGISEMAYIDARFSQDVLGENIVCGDSKCRIEVNNHGVKYAREEVETERAGTLVRARFNTQHYGIEIYFGSPDHFIKSKKEFETLLSTIKVTSVGVVDTSSWKTYRNEKYGFEVKYPFEWLCEVDRDYGEIDFKTQKNYDSSALTCVRQKDINRETEVPIIFIKVYTNQESLSLESWWSKYNQFMDGILEKQVNKKSILLPAGEAYRVTTNDLWSSFPIDDFYLANQNKVFQISNFALDKFETFVYNFKFLK